jgi:hypothetical protein
MGVFRIKRVSENLSMSRVAIVGPVPSDGSPIPGAAVQKLEFNLQESTEAFCDLTPGQTYIATIDMFGEIGGKISLSTKPDPSDAEYQDIGSLKIPLGAKPRKSAIGHVYSSAFHFTVGGVSS